MKNSFRFALVSFLAAALMGCVENGPAEDSDAKDCDASIDGNTPTPDAGVDAPPTPVNHVPVVRITAPSPNTTFDVGSSVTITTDAVDNDIVGGGVAKVELYYTVGADSQQTWVGEATRLSGNIYQGTWQTVGLAAGSYKLYATAKGDKWHHEGDVDITGSLPVTLTLASPLTPSVNVTVSTNNLSAPGPVTVSWMTNNVNGCTANWITGSVGTSGSVTVTVSTVGQNTFTVSCTGTSGSASDSEVVTLASPLTPSVNVTVSTNNLSAPGPVTVSWMTNNVNGCTANWITGSVGTSGSVTVTVSTVGQNTFTVNCTGTSGSASDSEVVTLASPSAMCSMDSQCPASYTWTQGYCSAGVCKQRAINCGGIKTRRTSALTDMLNAWGGWGGVQPAPDLGSVPITASYAWVPQAGACSVISAQPFDCTIEYYGGNGTLSFKEYTGVTKCSFDGKNNLPDDPTL